MSITSYLRQLVGNGKAATIGIFAFIIILCLTLCSHKAKAADVNVEAGTSFGTQGYGPTLGLNTHWPVAGLDGVNVIAGTDLWGSTAFKGTTVPNNWDWHAGIEGCKAWFCAFIGPAFVQRVDAINGAHTNYHLGFEIKLSDRLRIDLAHISDAGTSNPNVGRQAIMLEYRLQ
jgi:hypothetical protein